MKKWLRVTLTVLGTLVLVALGCCRVYENWWLYQQPKFQSVTIELGQEIPGIEAFLTEYADPDRVSMVSDPVDPAAVGIHPLVFRHISKEEQVTLTILDTTAPTAEFHDVVAVLGQELKPEDFVSDVFDLAETTVSFAQPPAIPRSYGDYHVEVQVADANGNTITASCSVFYTWMHESFTMELGDRAKPEDFLLDPEKDAALLDQAVLDALNESPAGTYTVTTKDGDLECSTVVTVEDTTPPELTLKEVSFFIGGTAELEDFVESATDLSGDVELELLTELDFETPGEQTVKISATDINGNVTVAETTLTITTDTVPPVIYGMDTMYVSKNQQINYYMGVSAYDDLDGYVSVYADTSTVDITRWGTYYVQYTARDNTGNIGRAWRTVVVSHDAADTAALVSSISAGLSSDPEAIRDYVRYNIVYSYSWGGGDPVWFGFKQWHGNCYVHAMCLKVLLESKGYTTQLIWVTDETHYWLQVYLDGKWVHMDATPGNTHTIYSIMNDEQRYETLKGRDWDRTKWPACE